MRLNLFKFGFNESMVLKYSYEKRFFCKATKQLVEKRTNQGAGKYKLEVITPTRNKIKRCNEHVLKKKICKSKKFFQLKNVFSLITRSSWLT